MNFFPLRKSALKGCMEHIKQTHTADNLEEIAEYLKKIMCKWMKMKIFLLNRIITNIYKVLKCNIRTIDQGQEENKDALRRVNFRTLTLQALYLKKSCSEWSTWQGRVEEGEASSSGPGRPTWRKWKIQNKEVLWNWTNHLLGEQVGATSLGR